MTGIIRFGRTAVGWRRTSTVDVPASGTATPPPAPTVLAPSNSALPIITGATTKGQTLSCSTGSWLNLPTGFAYQWLRSGTAISGANGATYLLIAADVAANISCTVTASNTTGPTPATSATVGPVIDLAPVNTVLPALTGTPTVGQVLTVSNGTWNNSPLTFVYAWQLNGSPISGAASVNTYTLTSGENGGTVTCVVTATNSGGSVSATSNGLGPVGAAGTAPTNTAVPTLSGDPVVGQTLFTTNGTWTGTVTSYTYQWFKDGTAISGQTNDNYLILDMDVGSVFLCKVTAYNVASPSTPAASAGTSAVANISLTNAITAFTRTSTSGTVPMTWSATFAANVYERYYLEARVYSDGSLATQTQFVRHLLTHADLQPGATIDLTSDGLTTIGATQFLQLTVSTTSPNAVYSSFTYPTTISPTDAVVSMFWDPANKTTNAVLSNSNLTMTLTASNQAVRSSHSVAAGGKYYAEFAPNLSGWAEIVLGDSSCTLAQVALGIGAGGPGTDTHSADLQFFDNFNIFAQYNNANSGTPAALWLNNQPIDICWNDTMFWWRQNNGAWQPAGSNPSAGTGGFSISGLPGPRYVFAYLATNTSITANFGTTPGGTAGFTRVLPTGAVAP